MANTFADLTPIIIASAVTAVGNKLAFLSDFTTDFSDEIVTPRKATVQVPYYSAGSTTLVDPTTFGGGTATSTTCTVVMSAFHQPFAVTNAEYQNTRRLEHQIEIQAQALANKIQAVVFGNLTTANFGAPVASLSAVAAGGMTSANLKTLWGLVKGDDKVCYLNATEYANFLPTDLNSFDPMLGRPAYGFSKFAHVDSFTGAGTKVCGFASAKGRGIVMASAIPDIAPMVRSQLQSTVFELGNGLMVQLNMWGSTSDRADNASFDVYFGSAVADTSAIELVTNA